MQVLRKILRLSGLAMALFLAACSGKKYGCDSDEGRTAIVADVDKALSSQQCAGALALIETYYARAGCGTDEIRQARAAANACAANINFFGLLTDLSESNILGNELWVTLTRLFPSTLTDQQVTAGQNALDALFAIRIPGVLTPPEYLVNATSEHPRSMVAAHRTKDSNLYAMMVSMSLIGSLQNRYGAPTGTYNQGQKLGFTVANPLGWELPAAVDVNACSYAGSVLTLFDSISQVSDTIGSSLGGPVGGALTTASTLFTGVLNMACDAGCQACGLAAGACDPCPTTLRNRFSCTGLVTDVNTCAATGIAQFMNSGPLGWP